MALPAPELSLGTPRILLLSLHPVHARRFFDREKKIEFRRTKPRVVAGDFVVFYVTSPVQAICGGGLVEGVLALPPKMLWHQTSRCAGLGKEAFEGYFEGCSVGYGIGFERVWEFRRALDVKSIGSRWPDFRPPQLYQYLTAADARKLGLTVLNGQLRTLTE
jgi:predicted transcriptional regulator